MLIVQGHLKTFFFKKDLLNQFIYYKIILLGIIGKIFPTFRKDYQKRYSIALLSHLFEIVRHTESINGNESGMADFFGIYLFFCKQV